MSKKIERDTLFAIHIAAIIFIIATLAAYYIKMHPSALSSENQDWSAFGEYVGGILGPALAYLALVALIRTIRIQQAELKSSVQQLQNSASELREQTNLQHKSYTSEIFFQLLSRHRSISDEVARSFDAPSIGAAFERMLIDSYYPLHYETKDPKSESRISEASEDFIKDKIKQLGNYVNTTKTIVKYIYDPAPTDATTSYEQTTRMQIFSAQLTFWETIFIVLCENTIPEFKKISIATEYSIFEINSHEATKIVESHYKKRHAQ